MRKGLMLAAASALVLAACQPAGEGPASPNIEEAASPPAADAISSRTAAADAGGPVPVTVAPPAPIARIAYAFSYVMSVPRDRGAELMSRHELACASAGPGYCQVVSAEADWTARKAGGRLELRGQPEWINRFRSQLATEARNAGGRLDSAITEGEDLTGGLDAAETGAKTTATLADRIQDLQARRGGTLEHRLEIERQLADLQRQYDAQQLQLRALNDRVQSARLTLDYRQGGVMAADSPTRPVARALSDAFGLSMGMLAVLITVGSALLPIAVIGGAVWWAVVRRRRKPAAA